VICPKAKGFNRSFERLEGVDIYRYGLPIDAKGCAWLHRRIPLVLPAELDEEPAGRGPGPWLRCHPCLQSARDLWLLAWFWRPFGKRFLFDHHDLSPEMYGGEVRSQ